MKNLSLVIISCLLLILSSCNKDEREARKTAFLYTQNTTSTSDLMLYIDDELVGTLPVVAGGILDCASKTQGIEELLDSGISTISVKDSNDDIIIDIDVEISRNGRLVALKDSRKGTGGITSLQPEEVDQTCLIIRLDE